MLISLLWFGCHATSRPQIPVTWCMESLECRIRSSQLQKNPNPITKIRHWSLITGSPSVRCSKTWSATCPDVTGISILHCLQAILPAAILAYPAGPLTGDMLLQITSKWCLIGCLLAWNPRQNDKFWVESKMVSYLPVAAVEAVLSQFAIWGTGILKVSATEELTQARP